MKTMIKTVITIAATLTFASSAYAQVASIAPEAFAQYGKDDAYWVAEVSCTQGGPVRVIQRKTDGTQWCGKDIADFCGESKDSAANKVCGTEYDSALSAVEDRARAEREAAEAQARANAKEAEQARAEQARKAQQERLRAQAERDRAQAERNRAQAEREKKIAAAAPLKKKISIEEQLIKIEQEKLDLRRQELELQRRAVEIQNALDKKNK